MLILQWFFQKIDQSYSNFHSKLSFRTLSPMNLSLHVFLLSEVRETFGGLPSSKAREVASFWRPSRPSPPCNLRGSSYFPLVLLSCGSKGMPKYCAHILYHPKKCVVKQKAFMFWFSSEISFNITYEVSTYYCYFLYLM